MRVRSLTAPHFRESAADRYYPFARKSCLLIGKLPTHRHLSICPFHKMIGLALFPLVAFTSTLSEVTAEAAPPVSSNKQFAFELSPTSRQESTVMLSDSPSTSLPRGKIKFTVKAVLWPQRQL